MASINASTSGAGGVITTADNTGILNIQTAGTNAVTVDASQNVGIGTATPVRKLHVSTSDDEVARFQSTGSPYISWHAGSTRRGYLSMETGVTALYNETAVPMLFGVNSVERMRIDTLGNVGIGTSSPTATLSMNTSQNALMTMQTPNYGGRMLGKIFLNGGSAETFNLFTITGFATTNTRVFATVKIVWANAIADQGGAATAWAGASQGGTRTQGAFVASQTWGTSVLGSLSWSGNTLRITTPNLSFIAGYIDVEYAAFDGASVTFDTSNQ